MNFQPTLSRITIYPFKSLDGISLKKATISEGGCLLHDREYAMFDEKGELINGKSNPLVHSLRTAFDFDKETVSFRLNDDVTWNEFHLVKEKSEIEAHLSMHFGMKVHIQQNKTGRFLDVPDRSGVTVLSEASLQTVADWFSINLDESRKRFRATLEFVNVTPFWEDQLFLEKGRVLELKIGDVTVFGMSPRPRCVVPSRNPETASVTRAFSKKFSKKRGDSLIEGSNLMSYGHSYHLSVDCLIPATEVGKSIRLGDKLTIIGEKENE
jgi:uncharacterized protein YcbX